MIQQSSIKKNFLWNMLLTGSNVLFPLITFPYVSRILLPESMGKVDFSLSIINYFIMFAALGIPTYGIRICSKVRENKEVLSKHVQELLIINVATTIIALIVLFLAVNYVPQLKNEKILYFIVSFNLIFNVLGLNWFYSSIENYRYIALRSIIFKLVSLVLIFCIVHSPEDYLKYTIINVFSVTGSNILNFYYSKKYISYKKIGDYNFKQHLKPILIFFATSVAISIYTNLDVVMLGFMSGNVEVGYYSAALKIRTALATLVTILSTVVLPRLSYYAGKQLDYEFNKLIKQSLSFTILTALPLTVFFILFAKESILILSGESYVNATLVLQFLALTVLFAGLSGVTGTQLLVPYGKEKILLYSIICGAVIDFLFNLFLIPPYGATGAALATVLAECAVLSIQILYSRKKLSQIVEFSEIMKKVIGVSVSVLVVSVMRRFFTGHVFINFCFATIIFFTIYFACLIIMKDKLLVKILADIKKGEIS